MQLRTPTKTSRPCPPFVGLALRAIACLTIGAVIVCVVLLSWVPPVSRDALIHHLAVPKLYLNHGHMYEIPSMVFSYFPMNLDLLYLVALYFNNDIAPKLIHFAFALLTAGLIFYYLKRRFDAFSGLLGIVLFLSLPIIVRLSTTVYVDLGLIFFGFASLLLLLRYAESDFQLRYLIFAGLCCGLALGTKYNGLLVFFILTCLVPFLNARRTDIPKPGLWRTGARVLVFVTVAMMVYAPWGIRNYSWTGNPIFPLYQQHFKKKATSEPPVAKNEPAGSSQPIVKIKSESLVYRRLAYGEPWWQIGLVPVRIFFQGQDDNAQYFDGRLNPYLLLFPLLAFFFGSVPTKHPAAVQIAREKKFLLAFAGLYFTFAFFLTGMRIRYIAPIIPPLVLLSAIGVKNIWERFGGMPNAAMRKTARGCVFALLVFLLAQNASYIVQQFQRVRPFDFLLGQVNRDEYIQRFRFEYPAQQFINAVLPENAKILFVFMGKRGYYCDREYIPEEKIFLRSVRRANDAGELCTELKREGITHLLVHGGFLGRWAEADLRDSQKRVLQDFFKRYVTLLFSQNGVDVFVLEDPCGTAPQRGGQRLLTSRQD